jgi:hypothetical protein
VNSRASARGGTVVSLLSVSREDAHAKRWREWQLNNEHHQRKGARRARMVFSAIFVAVGLWLCFQLLNGRVG